MKRNLKLKPSSPAVTPERLMQFAWGHAAPLIIEAAVRHGVFDLLDQSPKTAAQLASESGASPRGLVAILNALVGLQLLAKSGGRYVLTPESAAFLVSSKPGYHGAFFHHISSQLVPKWLELTDVVRTGKPALAVNQNKQGAKFFANFVESLFPLSYPAAKALGEHLGIPKTKTPVSVLDLAAGSGVWGVALAEQSPQVSVSAVDWPEVLKTTRSVARRQYVVADRKENHPPRRPAESQVCARAIPGGLRCWTWRSRHSEGRRTAARDLLPAKLSPQLSPGRRHCDHGVPAQRLTGLPGRTQALRVLA